MDNERNNEDRAAMGARWSRKLYELELQRLRQLVEEARNAMTNYLPVLERAESDPSYWLPITSGTGIATTNYYRLVLAKLPKPLQP